MPIVHDNDKKYFNFCQKMLRCWYLDENHNHLKLETIETA